jgi:hypothetical protein
MMQILMLYFFYVHFPYCGNVLKDIFMLFGQKILWTFMNKVLGGHDSMKVKKNLHDF